MTFPPGQKVFVLCGRVDIYGVSDHPRNDEPAIDRDTLSWMPMVVKSVEPDEDGEPGAWLIHEDRSETWYALRFISSWAYGNVPVRSPNAKLFRGDS